MRRMPSVVIMVALACGCNPQEESSVSLSDGKTQPATRMRSTSIDSPTPWEKVTWPWEKDSGYLSKRKEAIAKLVSVGVVPLTYESDFDFRPEFDKPEIQERVSRLRLQGFATETAEDELGYGPDSANKVTDQTLLENMKWFPEIRLLFLYATDVTDSGLEAVQGMQYLQEFRLEHYYPTEHPCLITDAGMKRLAQCSNLKTVWFVGTKITDEGIRHLSGLPRLEEITLEATFVTPECLRYLVTMHELRYIRIFGNRGAGGYLCYRDIPDYDRLSRPLSESAAEAMASAQGVPKTVRIEKTLVIDTTVFEALCATPTVERIELDLRAHWYFASTLAAISGQEHLKYVDCYETRHPTPEVIRVIEKVHNDSVHLSVGQKALSIAEWLKWARNSVLQDAQSVQNGSKDNSER